MKRDQEPEPRLQNLAQYEDAAREVLSRDVYDYYAGGADDERTLAWNRSAFGRWALRPRVLVDVGGVDPSVDLLGERVSFPVLLAPTAFQRLACPEGELATARASREAGSLYVASTLSTRTIEEIAAVAGERLWLQLYVFRDRGLTEALVRRAESAGCKAICLTVTIPVQGNRERDSRNRFALPPGVEMANFAGVDQSRFPESAGGSRLMAYIGREFDPQLTWSAIDWLRSVTRLPVVIKGVMTEEDAELAVEHGASAVIVSNHGGRQLDCAPATLDALQEVVAGARGRIPVLMDGGVRRGTDVVKALCLGATAVLIGRPYLWGLAVAGERGVSDVLGILRSEIERTMMLLGRRSLAELDRSILAPSNEDRNDSRMASLR